jgi:hypothetical protein
MISPPTIEDANGNVEKCSNLFVLGEVGQSEWQKKIQERLKREFIKLHSSIQRSDSHCWVNEAVSYAKTDISNGTSSLFSKLGSVWDFVFPNIEPERGEFWVVAGGPAAYVSHHKRYQRCVPEMLRNVPENIASCRAYWRMGQQQLTVNWISTYKEMSGSS